MDFGLMTGLESVICAFFNCMITHMKLVLASTSPFRKQLLDKLRLPYETASPDIDETPLHDESVEAMVIRLAEGKARAVAEQHPEALIIGSDQSAVLNGEVLHKPGNFDNAFQQLKNASGQKIIFQTGLCLYNSETQNTQSLCVPYTVVFKTLSDQQIENYLKAEEPYNCAGSFKSEALGIALFERLEGNDPNTLIGLPLIDLIKMLANEGMRAI